VPSWQAGDRRNMAGICEPTDKASSPSCEGGGGRTFNKSVLTVTSGGSIDISSNYFTIILPNTIHKSRKKLKKR